MRCLIALLLVLSFSASSQYVYEANQDLYQLQKNAGNFEGELAYEVGDDQLSVAIDLSFDFNFYGQTFDSARMATNGCLHFGLGTGNINFNNYCGDYTPDPLSTKNYTYTMLPFWTDLIRDNNSRMKSWGDNTKMIFGWYDMREYNRNSDNSFEIILWPNHTFEYRYDELDIINHDVLIGEIGANSNQSYTYLFYDECNTGTTNSSDCVNTNWNNSSFNTLLEGGGSLYGVGSGNGIDCSNPLNNSLCPGYAAAYQTQQCSLDALYSENCSGYWEAYDDLQCDLDPQYGPFCPGYRQQDSVAFFRHEEEFDYGIEEDFEMFNEPIFIEELFLFEEPLFTFREEPEFFEPIEELIFLPERQGPDDFEVLIAFEELEPFELQPLPTLPLLLENPLIDEFIFQETIRIEERPPEPEIIERFETREELEEWFEEQIVEEEPIEEALEELAEEEDEIIEEELLEEVDETREIKSNKSRNLRVVKSTVASATSNSYTSSSSNASTSTTSSATGSISNSPSISEQFSSSVSQTNQILSMDTNMGTSTTATVSSSTVGGETATVTSVVSNLSTGSESTQSIQSQINDALPTNTSASESEQLVENIVAQNLQNAQADITAEQEETGEYGDEATLVAYMGYNPNFVVYYGVTLTDTTNWYVPKTIYENNILVDNIEGFYKMAGQNLETLQKLRDLQPNLNGGAYELVRE